MTNSLEQQISGQQHEAVIKLLAFFDLFDFPLTAYEIYKNLKQKIKLVKIYEILEQEIAWQKLKITSSTDSQGIDYKFKKISDLKTYIQEKNGFYFLKDREELVTIRQQRYNYFYRKLKIAQNFVKLFKLFPSVLLISLANIIGSNNLRDSSDIDFFIITKQNRIWLSRLYCTGLAKIFKSRPNSHTKKDKICLSFYLAQDHLNLDKLKLKDADPYFDYWRQCLVPVYNKSKIYEHFLENNDLAYLNMFADQTSLRAKQINNLKKIYTLCQKIVGDFLEKQAKNLQLRIMPFALKTLANNSDGVVVNNQILKFYQGDRRREYAVKYRKKIYEIFKTNN